LVALASDEDHSSRRARRTAASPGWSASRSGRRRRHRSRHCFRRASDCCFARGKPTAGPHPLRSCPGTIASTTAASSCRLCLCHEPTRQLVGL